MIHNCRNGRFFFAAATVIAIGCGGDTSQTKSGSGGQADPSKAGRKLRIAVIPKGITHEFWKSIHAGALKAAAELGTVEVLWKGGATESDTVAQIRVVEDFISQGVDAIVLAPNDRAALVDVIETAGKKKIPVVVIDSGVDTQEIASFVSTDNYNGGVLAAREMGKQLGGKGGVVVLRYMVGSDSTEQREKGFLETIAKEFADIKVVSDNRHAGSTEGEALRAAENLLVGLKHVDGWFCPCEPVTSGAIKALADRGLTKKVKVVGFDAGSNILPSFKAGDIHALILQDPVNMGYLGVKSAAAAATGQKVERRIGTGETVVTSANFNEPAITALHSPDLKKWLKE